MGLYSLKKSTYKYGNVLSAGVENYTSYNNCIIYTELKPSCNTSELHVFYIERYVEKIYQNKEKHRNNLGLNVRILIRMVVLHNTAYSVHFSACSETILKPCITFLVSKDLYPRICVYHLYYTRIKWTFVPSRLRITFCTVVVGLCLSLRLKYYSDPVVTSTWEK